MTRNVNVPFGTTDGPTVARMNGRGTLRAGVTYRTHGDNTVTLRIDDDARPEFWCDVVIDLTALAEAVQAELNQGELDLSEPLPSNYCQDCGEGIPEGRLFCPDCNNEGVDPILDDRD